jgi:sodium-dependent phosphate cotransporter
LTVALVAAGQLSVAAAIPVMLGANIGTSVTNSIVALGHFNNKDEFKRAFTDAMVLDYFNIIAAIIFIIIEIYTRLLSWSATGLTNALVGVGVIELFDPLDFIVDPIVNFIVGVNQDTGWIVLIVAFILLYTALRGLVKALRAILNDDLEEKVKKYLFGSWWQAMLFELVITVAVQSSSITTSVIVPIIALGVVVAMTSLPYFLGANIGTSTTALIAAMSLAADGNPEGVASLTVAWVHMVFDLYAIALVYPIKYTRRLPVWLAEKSADFVTAGRVSVIGYIAALFYLLPFGAIWLTQDWQVAEFYEPVVLPEVEHLQQASSDDAQTQKPDASTNETSSNSE